MSSPPVTVAPDATLNDAAATMRERGVGSLVADGEIAGVVTRTDFVRAAAAGRDPAETSVEAYATAVVETTTANTAVVGMTTATDLAASLSER